MGNSLDQSFFFLPYTYTPEKWTSRYLNAIETLSSLSKIDYKQKIYFNEREGKFYNSNWKIAENLKGWIGSWAAGHLGGYEEALYRRLWKLSISDTIDGIERAKFRIKGILAIALRILEGKDTHPTLKISDLETQMRDLQKNLEKASAGLNKLQETYDSSTVKGADLRPVIANFCNELEKFSNEVIKEITERREKLIANQISKQPLPPPPLALESPEQQRNRSSSSEVDRSSPPVQTPPEPASLPVKIVGDPNLPSPFPYPGQNQAQLTFNATLANQFAKMKTYLESNQARLLSEMQASGQDYYRFKSKTDEIPWSILITKEKEFYYHLHISIVPKGQGGAQKSDKRAFHPAKKENIAKLSTKFHRKQKRKLQLATNEEALLRAFSKKELPNVVKLYDVHWRMSKGLIKQTLYMKQYTNGDLKSNFGRLQDKEKNKSILFETITGLAGIHAEGIVHRDLKPANVLLDDNDIAHLGDFGCSCRLNENVPIDGSPLYMAPELTKDLVKENPLDFFEEPVKHPATFEKDIWSFGMMMYGMLVNPTERFPWPWLKGVEKNNLYKKTIEDKETSFPEPDKEDIWLHTCWECLQIDPSKRPTAQKIKEKLTPFFSKS